MVVLDNKEIWRATLAGIKRSTREHMAIVMLDWPEIREVCCRLYCHITDGGEIGKEAYIEAICRGIERHRQGIRYSDWNRLKAFISGVVGSLSEKPYKVHARSGTWSLTNGEPLSTWAQGRGRLLVEHAEPIPQEVLTRAFYPRILPPRLIRIVAIVAGGQSSLA